jgi:hypothetical protein
VSETNSINHSKSKTPCQNKRTVTSTALYLHKSLHGYEESRGRKRQLLKRLVDSSTPPNKTKEICTHKKEEKTTEFIL